MSASPPKADILGGRLDVRYVPKADISLRSNDGREPYLAYVVYFPNDRAMASIPTHPRTIFSLSALTGSEENLTITTRVVGFIQMC